MSELVQVGSWVDCNPSVAHQGVKVKFFKRPNYPHPFCGLCRYEIQKRNGTLKQAPRPSNTSSWQKHSQSKAGKDLL